MVEGSSPFGLADVNPSPATPYVRGAWPFLGPESGRHSINTQLSFRGAAGGKGSQLSIVSCLTLLRRCHEAPAPSTRNRSSYASGYAAAVRFATVHWFERLTQQRVTLRCFERLSQRITGRIVNIPVWGDLHAELKLDVNVSHELNLIHPAVQSLREPGSSRVGRSTGRNLRQSRSTWHWRGQPPTAPRTYSLPRFPYGLECRSGTPRPPCGRPSALVNTVVLVDSDRGSRRIPA